MRPALRGSLFHAGPGPASPARVLALGLILRVVYRARRGDTTADRENFSKVLLVFGCIGTDLCKKIRVLKHFFTSTRLSNIVRPMRAKKTKKKYDLTEILNFADFATFAKYSL